MMITDKKVDIEVIEVIAETGEATETPEPIDLTMGEVPESPPGGFKPLGASCRLLGQIKAKIWNH